MVLIYAVGGDHRLREPSVRLLAAIDDARVEATTTIEVIQEFVHARGAADHGRTRLPSHGISL